MNEGRHPGLERLFAAADRELASDEFVALVMQRTSVLRRRRLVAALVAVLLAVPVTWLAAGPFVEALLSLTQALARPLAGSGQGITSPAVLPMNTLGGALALVALALRAVVRRLFSNGS